MNAKNTFLILVAFTSASALAQSQMESTPPAMDQSAASVAAMPEEQTENGITYVCGGIGENSADAMKQAASAYDLMVTFAATNGAYLADVNVDIADARGTSVLSTTCEGPIMLVDFPQGGNYRIRAEANGHTLIQTAQVRDGGRVKNLAMAWPVKTVDMGLTPALPAAQSSGSSGDSR